MSTFFISDLHLGHRNILKYSPERGGNTVDEHDAWIVKQWNSVVRSEKDLVWVLGDVCFDRDKLELLREMRGRKKLVRGNHDTFSEERYLEHFENIYGLHKRYDLWLSHAPLHEQSLRGRYNIHGHTHSTSVDHPAYINVSVEVLGGVPMSLEAVRERMV